MSSPQASARAGVLFATGAFVIWGVVPLYFSALRRVSALEVIGHRVVWSTGFLLLLLRLGPGFDGLRAVLRQPRMLGRLAVSAAMVSSNWLIFVWAVQAGRVLETSLGYYITPMVNVLLGFLVLGERLRAVQWVAVALAGVGVLNQVLQVGQAPWVSLGLAATFGGYGLLRKKIPVDPITGLLVETLLVGPFALGYLAWLGSEGRLAFGRQGLGNDVLLVLLGVVTAVPLLLFAAGAQRLRLATLGFLQYLAPTLSFLLAVFLLDEPFGTGRALTFALIWAGIAVYALSRREPRPA